MGKSQNLQQKKIDIKTETELDRLSDRSLRSGAIFGCTSGMTFVLGERNNDCKFFKSFQTNKQTGTKQKKKTQTNRCVLPLRMPNDDSFETI